MERAGPCLSGSKEEPAQGGALRLTSRQGVPVPACAFLLNVERPAPGDLLGDRTPCGPFPQWGEEEGLGVLCSSSWKNQTEPGPCFPDILVL